MRLAGREVPAKKEGRNVGGRGGRDMRLRRWMVILDPALNLILTQFRGFTKLGYILALQMTAGLGGGTTLV